MSVDEVVLSPWRTGVLTGSRIPKVLELSSFGGPDDVLREMVREHFGAEVEFTGNLATEHGQRFEGLAISEYRKTLSPWQRLYATGDEQQFVLHPSIEWLGVTPDGLVDDDGMVEVKVPWRANYVHISQRPGYEAQIRAQLECTGRAWCDFVVYRPDLPPGQRLWPSRVRRDNGEWLASVMPTFEAFLDRFRRTIADPKLFQPLLDPLRDVRSDDAWSEAAVLYQEALATQRAAEVEVEAARKRLIDLSAGRTSIGCGVRVQHSEVKGSVDYKQVVDKYAADADLDAFRKSSTHKVSVHLTGGRK